METIELYGRRFRTFISGEEVDRVLGALAQRLNADFCTREAAGGNAATETDGEAATGAGGEKTGAGGKNDNGGEVVARIGGLEYRKADIPIALCVLNGAMIFASDILKRTAFPMELASVRVSSYEGMQSSGKIRMDLPPTTEVKGRKVIIFEDIVETGTTVRYLIDYLKAQGAAEVYTCILFVKPGIFKNSYRLDYVGKEINDEFIVGRGFDYNGLGRDSEDIYILDEQ